MGDLRTSVDSGEVLCKIIIKQVDGLTILVCAVVALSGGPDVTFSRLTLFLKNYLQGMVAYQQLDTFCLHCA